MLAEQYDMDLFDNDQAFSTSIKHYSQSWNPEIPSAFHLSPRAYRTWWVLTTGGFGTVFGPCGPFVFVTCLDPFTTLSAHFGPFVELIPGAPFRVMMEIPGVSRQLNRPTPLGLAVRCHPLPSCPKLAMLPSCSRNSACQLCQPTTTAPAVASPVARLCHCSRGDT